MLLPVSTSTKIFHEVILPNASLIEFVRGRLHFEQKNEEGKFVSKGAGQHDSMVVVFQKRLGKETFYEEKIPNLEIKGE